MLEKRRDFLVATALGIVFSLALILASIELPIFINEMLISIAPDFGHDYASATAFIDYFRPVGYAAFIITMVLVVAGFALKRRSSVVVGSFAFYIPVFGAFAGAMFFLAGIGLTRILWLPLLDCCPWVLRLGHIVYLPTEIILAIAGPVILIGLLTSMLVIFVIPLLANTLTILGLIILAFGTATWLYGKFQGEQLVYYWIYRYTRHPQYLGFLLWSYGALISATYAGVPFGGLFLAPSFPWLITAMAITAIAMYEETRLASSLVEYADYRQKSAFLVPVPRQLAKLFRKPITLLIGKNWPETGKDVAVVCAFYMALLVLLSIPLSSLYLVFPI
ncbi:MAG: hypothetical protein EAX95_14715 [Candidatus Thorarchaeota archaeon]|nr:hypothetical protein [Candidatus Thorarchaeota archaeon]